MTTENHFFDMTVAPMQIGKVRLKVRDLATVSSFYQHVLGLVPLETARTHAVLGAAGVPLLELLGNPDLTALDRSQAGLFHTAFLMPTRADLGRWVAHLSAAGVPLQGASDHIVSEALYLNDPEGNGIEVYADRPVVNWHGDRGEIRMSTVPLDLQNLMQSSDGTEWSSFPETGSVGHVHLQVGDTAEADRFYHGVLGLDIAARYPGASFYGSGGYHHQLAANVWNSRRSGTRSERMAGLDTVEIIVRDTAQISAIAARAESAGSASVQSVDGLTLHDPWGTAIKLRS